MADHQSAIRVDGDWPITACTCGWKGGTCADEEAAVDGLIEHVIVATRSEAADAVRRTVRGELRDPNTWERVGRRIVTDRSYHYDTSDESHCIDLAQIVCTALGQIADKP